MKVTVLHQGLLQALRVPQVNTRSMMDLVVACLVLAEHILAHLDHLSALLVQLVTTSLKQARTCVASCAKRVSLLMDSRDSIVLAPASVARQESTHLGLVTMFAWIALQALTQIMLAEHHAPLVWRVIMNHSAVRNMPGFVPYRQVYK